MPDDMGHLEKIILSRIKIMKNTGYCSKCSCDNCIQKRINFENQRKKMTIAAVISSAL